MKPPLKPLSTSFKLFLTFLVIFLLAFVDYRLFWSRSNAIELYDELHAKTSSVRGGITQIEYKLDMFVVAGRFENTTVAVLRTDIEGIDRAMNEVFANQKYYALRHGNRIIDENMDSILEKWKSIKGDMLRLKETLPPEEVMLIHNSVDVNSINVSEMINGLIGAIGDARSEIFHEMKMLTFASIVVFMLIWACAAVIFYVRMFYPALHASDVARRIAAGDLYATFDDRRGGFMGALTTDLNVMLRALKGLIDVKDSNNLELTGEIFRKVGQIQTLNLLASFTGKSFSQSDIFAMVVKEAVASGGASASAIYLKDDGLLKLKASYGLPVATADEFGEITKPLLNDETLAVTRQFPDPALLPDERLAAKVKASGFSAVISVPVYYNGEIVGFLYLMKHNGAFNEEAVLFYEAEAALAGVASGHIGLFQREHSFKRFLERIINQMPFGIAIFDMDGVCVMVNGVLRNMLGAHPEFQFAGNYRIVDDDFLNTDAAISSIKRSYAGYASEFSMDYNPSLITRYGFGGASRRFKVKSAPLYGLEGEVSNIMLFYENISGEAKVPDGTGAPKTD